MRFPNTLASAIAAFGVFLCLAGPSFGEEDMKTDPYENAALGGSIHYYQWLDDHAFLIVPAISRVEAYLKTYKEFKFNSDGISSAFRENRSLIQITAPISQGSSGSPVMDEKGELIGVARLENTQGQNWNFAIAVEKVSAALMQPSNGQFSGPALPKVTPTPAIDADAHFDRGMAFLERREYDKAINEFSEAIRLDPNYVHAYVSRGNAYGIHGAVDKAIDDFTEAIRLDPNVAVLQVCSRGKNLRR
jgi:tetratricopeptide (TPR) repeat protein